MSLDAYETSVADLIQAFGLLVRRLRAVGKPQDLSLSQSSVLARLDKDGPATTAELARAESVKPQSMGTIVASLEALGLVGRKPHRSDGRQVQVELTPQGAALRKTTTDAKQTWLAQAVAGLDSQEQATLFAAGDIVRRLVQSPIGKGEDTNADHSIGKR